MSRADMDRSGAAVPLDLAWLGHTSQRLIPHISVCICSHRRPAMLKRLLFKLNEQVTEGLFTYSIVVADNDDNRSGVPVIAAMSAHFNVSVRYCIEPRRGIALARNKAIENAEGAFIALIDEDEFPDPDWLLTLYQNLCEHRADGVLGAVKRHFDDTPPIWLHKSSIYCRKANPTGTMVQWNESCTSNALLKRGMLVCDPMPFRPELCARADQDFFRRKMEAGYRFIWSADAVVSETITPARWKRRYILRKAIAQGAAEALQYDRTVASIVRSLLAIPFYLLLAPFALVLGQENFMHLMAAICNHVGKLLIWSGINPIREEQVSD